MVLVLRSEDRSILLLLGLQVLLNILLNICFVWHFAIIWFVLGLVVLDFDCINFDWPLVGGSLIFLIIVGHVLEERLGYRRLFLGRLERYIHVLLIFFLCRLFGWTSRFLTFDTLFLELLETDNIVVTNLDLRNNGIIFLCRRRVTILLAQFGTIVSTLGAI